MNLAVLYDIGRNSLIFVYNSIQKIKNIELRIFWQNKILNFMYFDMPFAIMKYDKHDFLIYNVQNELFPQEYTKKKINHWIALPNNNKELLEGRIPYCKLYYNKNNMERKLPSVESVVERLITSPTQMSSTHPNKPTLLFAWFANYFTHMFCRSSYKENQFKPHFNNPNSILNATPIYGSTIEAEKHFRYKQTHGKVIMHKSDDTAARYSDLPGATPEELLPILVHGAKPIDNLFASGIPRGNVSVGNYVFQTLLMRNHNRTCDKLKEWGWKDDEEMFQMAKTVNLYTFIKIVMTEYITAISTLHLNSNIKGYENFPQVIPFEYNIIYQWHALIPASIKINDSKSISLGAMVENPEVFYSKNIGEWLRIGCINHCKTLQHQNSPWFLKDVEIKMLKASRSADIVTYCEMRRKLGISFPKSFLELCNGNHTLAKECESLYETVEDVDFIVGCQMEPLEHNHFFSESISRILSIFALNGASILIDDFKTFLTEKEPRFQTEGFLAEISLLSFLKDNLSADEVKNVGDFSQIKFRDS